MPKRPRDDEEEDFEVVDEEERPKKKPRPPAKETSATRVDETDEYEERPRRRRRAEEDEDRPAAAGWGGDEDDDRPRKRKKPRLTKADRERMRREDEDAREKARENMIFEWTGPIALTFLGTLMTIVAGFIMARRTDGAINPALMLAAVTVKTLLTIPVTLVGLMMIGSAMGIDYGTVKNAVRSLVAIIFLVSGIYWIGNLYIGVGWFLAPMIAGLVTFALFMMFFSLDPQETSTSLGLLNVILWASNLLFVAVIVPWMAGGLGKKDGGDDFRNNRPPWQQKAPANNGPNQFDDDGDGN